jgi:hypothetical protein
LNDAPTNSTAWVRWVSVVSPLLIVLTAVVYYGSYLRYWFNPHDEGGTAAFTAMRLLAGEVPLRDVELGYNVGWFWPIVGLFKLGGVNFLLMRAYFFALSTVTALCGWMLVRRVTQNLWLALAVGLALVIFPGSQFKNYIPLLCVANMLAVITAVVGSGSSTSAFWRRVALGGLVLGVTLLVRIDLGYLFGLLWVGVVFLRFFDQRLPSRSHFIDTITAIAILGSGVVLTHLPAYVAASRGGYAREFVRQYRSWGDYLGGQAGTLVQTGAVSATPEQTRDSTKRTVQRAARARGDRSTLPRVDWRTFTAFTNSDKSVLFLLTYAPVVVYVVLLLWCGVAMIRAWLGGTFTLDSPATVALIVLIGSSAAFPQFFFFRPDRPHLSEFMPGYVVATITALALLRGKTRWLMAGFVAMQLAIFGWFAFDHYSAGTIAARINIKRSKRVLFEGANGVRVWVHAREHKELDGVRRAVVENSKPGDWLVCYPYQPGYNVITDRPTYERELYQDNAKAPPGWGRAAIARMNEKQPAVVIIDNRAINQVENSRFSRWAKNVYEFVRTNYDLAATIDTIEIYRRNKSSPSSSGPPPAR